MKKEALSKLMSNLINKCLYQLKRSMFYTPFVPNYKMNQKKVKTTYNLEQREYIRRVNLKGGITHQKNLEGP
jgi:hypothetical protein